jgi:hypothetical protein
MFTDYLRWWDQHPWMIFVVLGTTVTIVIWTRYKK